jgi:hypothetical protein
VKFQKATRYFSLNVSWGLNEKELHSLVDAVDAN